MSKVKFKVTAVAGEISGPAGSVKELAGLNLEVDTPENLLSEQDPKVPVIIWCSEPYENPPVQVEEINCDGDCGKRVMISATSRHLADEAQKRGQEAKFLCAWCCKEALEGLHEFTEPDKK